MDCTSCLTKFKVYPVKSVVSYDIPSLIIFMNQIISLRPLQVHRL